MHRKRVALISASVIALLIGVVLALPYIVDVNRYRGPIQTALRERLKRPVTVGQMRLSLLPPGLRVADAVVGEDPSLRTERPFAQVEEIFVSPRLLPLLAGRFELEAVELRRPAIELVRTSSGAWNFSTLGGRTEQPAGESTFVLNRLLISGGRIALTDLRARQPGRNVYDRIDLDVRGYARDRAFDLVLAATLPGDGAERLSLRGTAGPVVSDDPMKTPFEGELGLDAVSIGGVQRFLQIEALEGTDASISGTAEVSNREGRLTSKGSLRLDRARARGVDIGYPITTDFDVVHDLTAGVLRINAGTLRLDETPLSLTGTVDLGPETPALDLRVAASDASVAEAARLASAFGVAFGAGTQVQGQLNADVRLRGPASRPALDGQLRLRNVSIAGGGIPQPVRTDAIDVTLTPAEIRTNEFSARAGATSLAVRGALRQYTSATPLVDAYVRTSGADLGEVLNVARAWGVGAVEGMTGTGRLAVDVRASGPTDNLTLAGSGSLTDATVSAPSIAQPLRIRNAGLTFSRNAAVLEPLSASIGKTNAEGRLSVRNFTAPRVEFQLSADRIDVRELQQIFAAGQTEARSSQAPASDSLLLRTTGSGRLRVGSIAYDRILLSDVQAVASLDRGTIRLDPLTAALYGGRHRGAIVMDTRRTPATISVASDLERVDANQLASAVTNLRDVIHGALGSKVRMTFATESGDRLARSLNGTLSLNLAEGRVANMDITHEIANIARFITGRERTERSTRVAALSGTFDVTNGVARTEDLTASIGSGTLGVTGAVGLADQSLNLRLTAVLSREFSQRVGGSRVLGFMSTALANEHGELVVPLLVSGTTSWPRFAADTVRIAEMRRRNAAPNLRDPQGLSSTILGEIDRGREGAPKPLDDLVGAIAGRGKAAAQQEPPKEGQEPSKEGTAPAADRTVGDVLKGLLRGRKTEEAKPPPPEPAPK